MIPDPPLQKKIFIRRVRRVRHTETHVPAIDRARAKTRRAFVFFRHAETPTETPTETPDAGGK